MDHLQEYIEAMQAELRSKAAHFYGDDFARAAVGACVLIAASDGAISHDERQRISGFMGHAVVLKQFDISQLRSYFDYFCNSLASDYHMTKSEVIQLVSQLRDRPEQAAAALQLAMIVATSDRVVSQREKDTLRELAAAAGVDPVGLGF
jgi:tellurite resistance protein TerB